MQAKELETLHHIPLHPREQRTETCFSSFVEGSLSVFCKVTMFEGAMLFEHVVACESDMAQFARDRRRSDGLARLVMPSKLCNAAGVVVPRQTLRS